MWLPCTVIRAFAQHFFIIYITQHYTWLPCAMISALFLFVFHGDLILLVAGLVPLFTSTYSDEEIDLVNGFMILNGVTSFLSHFTLLRIFGQPDALSINIGVALYVKAIALASFPSLCVSPVRCVNAAQQSATPLHVRSRALAPLQCPLAAAHY